MSTATRASTRWVPVTRDEPCVACGSDNWCSRATDGSATKCQRVSDGCDYAGEDRNHVPFYVFRNVNGNDHSHTISARVAEARPTVERADIATRDEAYRLVLDSLTLSTGHRESLRSRGLDDAEIDQNQYRTLDAKGRHAAAVRLMAKYDKLAVAIPGFSSSGFGSTGMLIACRDVDGRIVALRVRRDDAGDGPKYLWVSSTKTGGAGSGVHCHVALHDAACSASVYLTEGELKADVITSLTGTRAASVPGVSSWRQCIKPLKAIGARQVILAFDADAKSNEHVALALHDAHEHLSNNGFQVEVAAWK